MLFSLGQTKGQSSVVAVKEVVPEAERKALSPAAEKRLMFPSAEPAATEQECEQAVKNVLQPSPVQLKKSRRVLFEPLASNKPQEMEGW